MELDSERYHYPTATAFVPHPGPGPQDPLYFVNELRGAVRVVTNDRMVHTFAKDFLNTEFYDQLPQHEAEFGLAGICLEPKHGFVFVTFAYQDGATLRNIIMCFDTTPRMFALKPRAQHAFTDVFAVHTLGVSHQIGGCQVNDNIRYVGVGDGWNSADGSQRLDIVQGKVVRMTLDGKPAPGNPSYKDDDIQRRPTMYGLTG